jgi:uncharacterized membrane protein YfcA
VEPLILLLVGFITFAISTVTAGGGALMQIPIVTYLIGADSAAPVINLGTFIGRPSRLILFWKQIDWSVTVIYVLTAIPGTWIAGYFFSQVNVVWLKVFIAVFLISTIFQFRLGSKRGILKIKKWHFSILGFSVPLISTLVGGMGPVLNPFYLGYGLKKEDLIATKTANSFFVGLAQIGAY